MPDSSLADELNSCTPVHIFKHTGKTRHSKCTTHPLVPRKMRATRCQIRIWRTNQTAAPRSRHTQRSLAASRRLGGWSAAARSRPAAWHVSALCVRGGPWVHTTARPLITIMGV